ncbi:hypothetical protein [Mycoplasmopsis caviae]|uniref:hypothetical protein n=1 Tax=Mycoplasmopsis caviae TaxID=55603 RepID=UPI000F7E656B|nr:hypothetical protein [Mycoplasmopsis caviae]
MNNINTKRERWSLKWEETNKGFHLTGLKLLSEDYKIWDEGVLAKLNEDKTTNSISKSWLITKMLKCCKLSVFWIFQSFNRQKTYWQNILLVKEK